jgi:hypothetical protein
MVMDMAAPLLFGVARSPGDRCFTLHGSAFAAGQPVVVEPYSIR